MLSPASAASSSATSHWPASKASRVLAALQRIGWKPKRAVNSKRSGSHLVLERSGYANYVWAHHDSVEIGPPMLAKIAKKTGLKPEDL